MRVLWASLFSKKKFDIFSAIFTFHSGNSDLATDRLTVLATWILQTAFWWWVSAGTFSLMGDQTSALNTSETTGYQQNVWSASQILALQVFPLAFNASLSKFKAEDFRTWKISSRHNFHICFDSWLILFFTLWSLHLALFFRGACIFLFSVWAILLGKCVITGVKLYLNCCNVLSEWHFLLNIFLALHNNHLKVRQSCVFSPRHNFKFTSQSCHWQLLCKERN